MRRKHLKKVEEQGECLQRCPEVPVFPTRGLHGVTQDAGVTLHHAYCSLRIAKGTWGVKQLQVHCSEYPRWLCEPAMPGVCESDWAGDMRPVLKETVIERRLEKCSLQTWPLFFQIHTPEKSTY